MEMNTNCPVCGKAGLPDYRKEEVSCPACDTNLKAYMLFNNIEKKQKSNYTIILFAVPCLLFIISLLFIFNRESHYNNLQHQYDERIALLNDSISLLKKEIPINVYNEPIAKSDIAIVYTIKKGDSFCLISRKIYGTEKHARAIAETNQMNLSTKLFPGNDLMIPRI